jgi:UDP-N-acetylmuramoyl-tripeptide--D-alanyl-D-alanine ligase
LRLGAEQIAEAFGAEILARGEAAAPARATIGSGDTGPGDLFFGLPGERVNGGEFALAAIEAGAWGVVVDPEMAAKLSSSPAGDDPTAGAWVFSVADPLAALQAVARAWRRELGARVVGVTGSVGKTSVKDIARALLPGRVHANRENLNTEIGLPLTVLEAPGDTDVLVLEMAMRGAGQIAELAAIAEPEVAVITNVGPVHVELLGSVEAIAAAKAEVLAALPPGGTAIVPAPAATSSRSRAGSWTASPRRWSRRPLDASRSSSPSPRRTTSRTRWRPLPPAWRWARRLPRWPTALRT